ncbi:hypothetical protein AB7M49_003387 [Bradyrhizobium elkanii]|uniref:hypothetical protein n=1 Tax=Bradyrhizobium elkanii TaxID=29448 RepID=UPI000841D568|nr:hypothetical protein [Bradyrhizobium elkanii]MCP1972779.1 hypothetical protein [Bradyrhizobium elkanii]MCS3519975.1 hypothetical protein [Bradyrhizobium elkanii]MCS4067630.1 hypothetical protein [Bradyrhizobium elkanii]MCS4083166.1 hypothetical protein [Bradyrhizobium elkanii]MCS4105713.1 hypothetical protein [Bradyrhizobium elkanii]
MSDTAARAAPAPQISPDNPCPFLRALVAGNYVGGHIVPLPELTGTIGRATGKTGFEGLTARAKIFMVAQIANGLGPFSQLRSLFQGAILDALRNGPLDKHGAGSRILDQHAVVHEDEIARLATFGKDYKAPEGSVERGLSAAEIKTFMAANFQRARDEHPQSYGILHCYYPLLMLGEWPVLLDIMGKGEGKDRYLSVAEVRTLFVDKRFPDRIVALLQR